jgi:hypothetical protein
VGMWVEEGGTLVPLDAIRGGFFNPVWRSPRCSGNPLTIQ